MPRHTLAATCRQSPVSASPYVVIPALSLLEKVANHLELAKPVYHHGFIKNVISVLRCVGFSSSKLMIDKVRHDAWRKTPAARARGKPDWPP